MLNVLMLITFAAQPEEELPSPSRVGPVELTVIRDVGTAVSYEATDKSS